MENNEVVLNENKAIPEEIKRWNWGAFFLTWIWGIGHNTFISLLTLIPFVGIVMPFVLGLKGNEWAWKNGNWNSVDEFLKRQKKWAIAGFAFVIGVILFAVFIINLVFTFLSNSTPAKDAMEIINNSPSVVYELGEPIKKGRFVSGSINISGPTGSAELAIPLRGQEKNGVAYVSATRDMGEWNINGLEVYIEGKEERIILIDSVTGKSYKEI